MCSISGFIRLNKGNWSNEDTCKRLKDLIIRSTERGKDSVGVVSITRFGEIRVEKRIKPDSYEFIYKVINEDTSIVIANNRAEPTTEFIQHKSLDDVQPFLAEHLVVSHNGVVANDRELCNSYKLTPSTRIDSGVIPHLIENVGLEVGLKELVGSYALAIADRHMPQKLWLACNYKPIFMRNDKEHGIIWFGSQAEYLQPDQSIPGQLWADPVVPISPYSLVEIDAQTGEVKETILEPRERHRRALVICSGGLDSTTTARWAQINGYKITLLYFRYHCRAELREVEAVKAIAKALGCDYRIEDLSWLGKLGGNPLTDTSIPIHEGEAGAEFAYEWVPARNMVFCALAAALADRYDYDTILLGLNLEEGGAYPDNTVGFYSSMDMACNIGTKSRPRILSPLANYVKHEIVRLALDIGAPIHLSWSCYEGGNVHCGKCGPCYMRRQAFLMCGVPDTLLYADQITLE